MCVGPLAPKTPDLPPPTPPPPAPEKTPEAPIVKRTQGRDSAGARAARGGNSPLRIALNVAQPGNGLTIPQG